MTSYQFLIDSEGSFSQDSCPSALFRLTHFSWTYKVLSLTRRHFVFVPRNQNQLYKTQLSKKQAMAFNNDLLSFVNTASSDIQVALGKPPKRRRNVNVRKFAENRVKRLDSKPRKVMGSASTTGSKSALPKPVYKPGDLIHRYTWPNLYLTSGSAMPVQSVGIPTCSFPTSTTTTTTTLLPRSNSHNSLCLPSPPPRLIDPELESLLSEFESPSAPISRHDSFESVCTVTSSCTPPSNTQAHVCMTDHAYSPYSDYSDDLSDSAYCSPVESSRVSYNCSPINLSTDIPSDWTTPISSSSPDWLPPVSTVTSTCLQDVCIVSSGCDWMSSRASSPLSSTATIYDQGPPMTPTVSQLLEQYNQY